MSNNGILNSRHGVNKSFFLKKRERFYFQSQKLKTGTRASKVPLPLKTKDLLNECIIHLRLSNKFVFFAFFPVCFMQETKTSHGNDIWIFA